MEYAILGNTTGDWLVALVATLVVVVGLDALRAILVRRLGVLAARTTTRADDLALAALRATRRPVLVVIGLYAGASLLALPVRLQLFLNHAAIAAGLVQCALWGDGAVRAWLSGYHARGADDPGRATSSAAIGFVARLLLWALAALMILDNLGVDITTLVASLGIGGIAVALAVQNVLGDLFASLSIVLDKPFVVGDFITVDTVAGTVEYVGLKTTRVRALGGEQIVFSNADLLKSRIHNLRRMQTRRIVFAFGVTYDTPAAQLRALPSLVEGIVTTQPGVQFDRAHFKGLGASSLDYEVVYIVDSADYRVYMDVQQEIYLQLVETLAREGIEFAFPTQTLHLARTQSKAAGAAPDGLEEAPAPRRAAG